MTCIDLTGPWMLVRFVICFELVSLAEQVSLGQGMVAAGLFKQGVLQFFCFKMLVRKCKEFLWFLQPY